MVDTNLRVSCWFVRQFRELMIKVNAGALIVNGKTKTCIWTFLPQLPSSKHIFPTG